VTHLWSIPEPASGGTESATHGTMAALALSVSPHVSWRRTVFVMTCALLALMIAVGGFMALRVLGIGPAGSLFGKGSLANRDRILVADFSSPAADSALGGTVSEMLRSSLAQSHAVSVISAAGIGEALRRMEKPSDARLDVPLARELAEREGAKAIIHGEV